MTAVLDFTGARGVTSGMARCARQGAYAALATQPDPTPVDMAEFFRRGKWFEMMRLAEIEAVHGKENVQRARRVPWEAGGELFAGEMDGYLPLVRTAVEIVSSVAPSADAIGHKVEQCRTYIVLDPEAERGIVDVINPSSLVADEHIPVTVNARQREEVLAKVEAVGAALESGGADMPDRVCEHPREARGRMCRFAGTCFAEFVEPWVELDDPEVKQAAAAAWQALELRVEHTRALVTADRDYRDQLDRLAELGVQPGKTTIGDIDIARTVVKGKTTFKFALAVKAGAVDRSQVEEFVTVGAPHERWTLKRRGEGDLLEPDDFEMPEF